MSLTIFRVSIVLTLLALLNAPVHAEKNLKRPAGTTRYAPMVAQLKSLLHYDKTLGAGRMELSSIGHSVKGRDIWMVTLHDRSAPVSANQESAPTPGDANEEAAASPAPPLLGAEVAPKKIFYLCRQHGHEPAGTEGSLAFIRDLVKAKPDTPLADDLRRVTVYIVPMANPDGAEAFLRHNAHNVDLNRDWLRRTQPETRAWYKTIMTLHPDLMTDQHELYPNDTRLDFTETAGVGSGASANVIRTCTETQAVVQTYMTAEGFSAVSHTITDQHPARLAHRYGCIVMGVPTILFETNRLTGTGRAVAARGQAHDQFMMTVLRDLAGERQELLAEAADRMSLRSNRELASRHKPYQRPTVTPAPPTDPEPLSVQDVPTAPLLGAGAPTTQGSE